MLQTSASSASTTNEHPPPASVQHRGLRVVLVIVLTIILVAIVAPSFPERYLPSGAFRQAELRRDALQQRLNRARQTAAVLASIPDTERQRLVIALPQGVSQGEAELLVAVEALAEAARAVAVEEVHFTNESATYTMAKNQSIVARVLEVKGKVSDYAGLQRLIEAVERNLRLLDITHLRYEASTGSVSMTLQAYALR